MKFLQPWFQQPLERNLVSKKIQQYIPPKLRKEEGIILRFVSAQKIVNLAKSNVKAWKLVKVKPLLLLPSKLQHTACWIQPDIRRRRYIAHNFKPADKKEDSCFFFYVSNKRQSNVIFTCIQYNTGLKAYIWYPNKKYAIRLSICVLKLSSATHRSVP